MSISEAETIAEALGGKQRAGEGWPCFCPAHNNSRSPALSLENKVGKLVWKCWGGCSQEAVCWGYKRGVFAKADKTTIRRAF
jgi:hypothetical protein